MDMNLLTTNKYFAWTNACQYLVLHHTAVWNNPTWENMAKSLSWPDWTGWLSVHYVVWQDGTVWKIWDDTNIMWHVWVWDYPGVPSNKMNFYAMR